MQGKKKERRERGGREGREKKGKGTGRLLNTTRARGTQKMHVTRT